MKSSNIESYKEQQYLQQMKVLGLPQQLFQSSMSEHTYRLIQNIKLKDRHHLKLSQWNKKQYKKKQIIKQLQLNQQQLQKQSKYHSVDRISCQNLTQSQFVQKYQKLNKPVIIQNLSTNWKASTKWTFKYFYQYFKDQKFKIGQDDDGVKMKIPYQNYLQYLVFNDDDSPLYLFQTNLQHHNKKKQLIQDYEVPKYFKEDLLQYAGQNLRPPYRWILIGPQRSGSNVHIDPNNTSAWNTSLKGRKRWVLFSNQIPKSIVFGTKYKQKNVNQDEAINYFLNILPKIKAQFTQDKIKIIQFIQYPGETVFIPGGWWHAVLNLDNTIAVTQNVMTSYNFQSVWTNLRIQNKNSVVRELYLKFKQNRPQLFQKILKIQQNLKDGIFTQFQECADLSVSQHEKIQDMNKILQEDEIIVKLNLKRQIQDNNQDDFFDDFQNQRSNILIVAKNNNLKDKDNSTNEFKILKKQIFSKSLQNKLNKYKDKIFYKYKDKYKQI